jgi:HlyD family secretion protein
MLRAVPNAPERLNDFDHASLRDSVQSKEKAATERLRASVAKILQWRASANFNVLTSALRSKIEWLFSDAPAAGDATRDFAGYLVRAHELHLKVSARVLLISAAVAGGWATLIPLSGAVVLPGSLVVESSIKKIQHPTGGVVAEIAVQDGMHVQAGSLLIRLDRTQLQANQQVIANQLDQVQMRIARLTSERDGLDQIQLPAQLASRLNDPGVAHLVASETALFRARAGAQRGQKDLYASNIRQFEQQIDGLAAEIQSKSSQLDLINKELAGVQQLYAKGLVPLTRMTALQRDSAQLEGERAQLSASIAETKVKIGQAQLQIAQVDQDFRSEVIKDLREAQDKEADLTERNVAAKDQLDRVEIRSPVSGVVHQLAVHTVGGVIRPGDVIMQIVPDSDDLEIEGHLPPNEIDQVARNQQAYLRFSTLDRRTMPAVKGVVTYVSADLTRDEQGGSGFYTVKIDLPEGERRQLNGMTLVSGMPVEIFLQTGSRTMLSYLFKPITNQLHRMFNEP